MLPLGVMAGHALANTEEIEFEGVTEDARKRIHDYIVEEFVKNYEQPN